jgi:hypothetical protein
MAPHRTPKIIHSFVSFLALSTSIFPVYAIHDRGIHQLRSITSLVSAAEPSYGNVSVECNVNWAHEF